MVGAVEVETGGIILLLWVRYGKRVDENRSARIGTDAAPLLLLSFPDPGRIQILLLGKAVFHWYFYVFLTAHSMLSSILEKPKVGWVLAFINAVVIKVSN